MPPPIPIPADVSEWLSGVFAGCNRRVSAVLSTVPTTHETPLDMTFIQHFVGVAAPHRFSSQWTVNVETHYLGGGRHWSEMPDIPPKWEIADIGLMVIFRHGGKLLRTKVALLQSKRLYADELEWEEDSHLDYIVGFRRLLIAEDDWARVTEPRLFGFTETSRYKALVKGVGQYDRINAYERQRNVPVYYMLYNPMAVPSSAVVPIEPGRIEPVNNGVGCRIVPATDVHALMAARPDGSSPSYGDLTGLKAACNVDGHSAGWSLEHFVVNMVLDCQAGYIAESPTDGGLNYIFNRRSGPISAALAITLDAPAIA